jgi:hypothetical protein
MRAWGLPLFFAFGALVGAGPAAAETPPKANCAVRMIQASHEGSGIDTRITRLRPYLEKAPFTAWKKFELLGEKDLALAPGGTDKFDLPNGNAASLTYVDHVMSPQGKHRLRLKLEIDHGEKKEVNTTFVLDEGGVVLQAGQKIGKGMLILGVSCDIPND